MLTERFEIALMQDIKRLKRSMSELDDCSVSIRKWNLYKVHLMGLNLFMKKHPDITIEQVLDLLKSNSYHFKILNECIKLVPDLFDDLKEDDYDNILDKMYTFQRERIINKHNVGNL